MEEINLIGTNINDIKASPPNFIGKKIGDIGGVIVEDVPSTTIATNTTDQVVETNIDDGIKIDYMSDIQVNNSPREGYFGMQKIDNAEYIQNLAGMESNLFQDFTRAFANTTIDTAQTIKRFGTKIGAKATIGAQLGLRKLKGEDISGKYSEWNRRIAVELNEIAKQNLKTRQELGIAKTEYDGITYDLGSVFSQIGFAVATKSATLMSTVFGLQQQQQISEEVFETTGEPTRAELVATGVAIPTALLEFVGVDRYLKVLKGNGGVGKVIQGFAIEALEEGSQAIIEEIGLQTFGGREKELQQTIKDTAYQMILGGIGGGTIAGMSSIGQSILQKQGIKKQPAKQISDSMAKNISESQEIQDFTVDILNRETDNTTFLGNNIDNGIAEVKQAIENTGAKVQPVQLTPVEILIQEARGTNTNLGETELFDILETYDDAIKRKDKLKPKSLIQFIKENGGIYDEQGDLASRELQKQFPFVVRKSPFTEVQTAQGKVKKDIRPDQVALRAWEANYFAGKTERPTVNELLDAINAELRGEKIIKEVDVETEIERQELENIIEQTEASGIDIDKIRTLKDYREGKIKLPGELEQEEALKQISEQQLREVRQREEQEKQRLGELEVQRAINDINRKITPKKDKTELSIIENALKPISSILKEIDPRIAEKLRTNIRQSNTRINKWQKEISSFIGKASKMTKEDSVALDIALKNKTNSTLNSLFDKYDMTQDWKRARKVLDDAYDLATKTGSNFGYEKDYFPRKVKDYSGLLKHFEGREDWGEMQQYLKDIGLQHASPQEQAEALNLYINGSVFRKIDTTKRGFEKAKRVDLITTEMNDFYDNSLSAFINYLGNINNSIAINEFFNKNPGTIESGVSELLAGLTNNAQITPGEQTRIRQALKDYFRSPKTSTNIQIYKNVSYLTWLTNIGSALTQIKDSWLSLYKNGVFHTANAFITKKEITAAELGINKAMEEIEDIQSTIFKSDATLEKANKKINKFLKISLKLNLFNIADRFGKNLFVQSALNKYTSLAKKKNTKNLKAEISQAFGDERADIIINDLKNDNISDEVKNFLFYKISDVVPISRAEMPSAYNRSAGARLFYTFKSFTIKQLDIVNQDVVRQIKEGNITTGFKNLTMITFFYSLVGVPIDMLQDFIFNRTEDKELINDYVLDNILQVGGISKWNVYNFKRNGAEIALLQTITPPLPVIVNLTRDIMGEEDFEDWRTAKDIPIGGKMYYWWFGGGSE